MLPQAHVQTQANGQPSSVPSVQMTVSTPHSVTLYAAAGSCPDTGHLATIKHAIHANDSLDLHFVTICAAGSCPDSGCLATDGEDDLLLCLHSSKSGHLTALHLMPQGNSSTAEVYKSPALA